MSRTVAIVLAAGQGKRMNSSCKKQYMLLREKPLLYYSLKVFQDSFVDDIILVVNAGEEEQVHRDIVEYYQFNKVAAVVSGGKERYHSVAAGLKAADRIILKKADDYSYCFIHDSARPFLTRTVLERSYEEVQKYRACVVGMPVKDTVKVADESGYVDYTPRRDLVWAVQTPQVFEYQLVYRAYKDLLEKEEKTLADGISITDDAMVVETFTNSRVRLVEGSYNNIKITTPEDLITAERILDSIRLK
jgi:2-C-methyl-D-erythritol 4-phosphate cytidylyltransferase